jgi:hypothetical protein
MVPENHGMLLFLLCCLIDKFAIEISGYYNLINDFIYLKPYCHNTHHQRHFLLIVMNRQMQHLKVSMQWSDITTDHTELHMRPIL